jgi:hypothetical protein
MTRKISTGLAAVLGLGLSAVAGAQPPTAPPPDGATPVATVNGVVISVDAFRAEMSRRGVTGARAGLKQREALLEEMVRLEVLAAKAKSAGYDKDPEIVAATKRLMADKLLRDQAAAQTPAVPDTAVAQYYAGHVSEFGAVERRRAAVIFVRVSAAAPADKKAEARERATRALAEAQKQDPKVGSFGPIAAKYSDDQATRYVGGDAGWIRSGESTRFDPAVVAALFRLSQPGEVGPVVEASGGSYVVKLVEKDAGVARPLASVKPQIVRQLAQESAVRARQQAYEQLRAGVQVSVDRAVLAALEPPPGARGSGDGDEQPPVLPQAH